MKAVLQQETTGCPIVCAAAISAIESEAAKTVTNRLRIHADDEALWSSTQPIRDLLKELGVKTAASEKTFTTWDNLPGCALISLKWHLEKGKPFWHWAIFVRTNKKSYVIDSNKSLKTNYRTDFGRMNPKWFIEVYSR